MSVVRLSGTVDEAAGLGRHDHVYWSYEDAEILGPSVVAFLSDGVRAGQRVGYAALGDEADLLDVVSGLDGWRQLLASRALVLLPLGGVYGAAADLDPVAQVATYRSHTREALRDGFEGFRVAAEATPLVLDATKRRAFVRYEQLVDRYMAAEPFAALCAYDTTRLSPAELEELACVHPAVHAADPPLFRLYAAGPDRSVLVGAVDSSCAVLFERVVADLPPGVTSLDLTNLDFIDHHGLLALDRAATGHGLLLLGARPVVARLCDLLRLEHLTVA